MFGGKSISRIRTTIDIIKESDNKKDVVFDCLKGFKEGGLYKVRDVLRNERSNRHADDSMHTADDGNESLYLEELQSYDMSYEQNYRVGLLCLIYIDSDISYEDTFNTLHAQTGQCDAIDTFTDWNNLINIISESKQEYVFIIKGGNYVSPYMRYEFSQKMELLEDDIIYSNESVFDYSSGKIVKELQSSGKTA